MFVPGRVSQLIDQAVRAPDATLPTTVSATLSAGEHRQATFP